MHPSAFASFTGVSPVLAQPDAFVAAAPDASLVPASRSSRILHRQVTKVPARAVSAQGMTITDAEGRTYLDASGGAAVSCLGHGDPKVIAAIAEQAQALAFAHTAFFTSAPAEALADRLIAQARETIPGNRLGRAVFLAGGSEANETALKLARQYFIETGQPRRYKIVARRRSYHGNTLGALAAGGNIGRREPFEPLLMPVPRIPACYAYREQAADETAAAYGLRAADALEEAIQREGPDTVAAFIAEPVVGASGGAIPPAPGYFARIREICDRYGVLLILDEVMCGMGRTGSLFACAQEGISPDLLTAAKGLGGGYQPIGAILVAETIATAIERGSGALQGGHTTMGHPIACAASLAVLDRLLDDGLLARVPEAGAHLRGLLQDRLGDHPHIGDIRGRGLFLGLELVRDRASKHTFDAGIRLHARVKAAAMAEGLICYPAGGTADGTRGDHILLAPPFIVTTDDASEIVSRLGRALDHALEGLA